MNKTVLLFVFLASPLAAAEAVAQTGIRAPQGWSLGIFGGAAAFSDMQRGSVRVEDRELARRVGAETSTTLGGFLAFWPSQNWGLRAHGTWSPSRFETVMHEGEAEDAGIISTSAEGERLAGLSIMSADLHFMFRLPTIKNRVMPYGILGAGAARYSVQTGDEPVPDEAQGDFEGGVKVRPAATLGLGAMLPMRNRSFRLHFELMNQVAATPLEGGSRQSILREDGTIVLDPRDEPAGERRVSVMNNVRFVVGASWAPRK